MGKNMSTEIEDKIDDHEHRITNLEINGGRLDERLDALVSSTNNLKIGLWLFTFIMLLTMVWQILGRQGFSDVTGAVGLPRNQIQKISK